MQVVWGEIYTKDKGASGVVSQEEDEASVLVSVLMGCFKNQLEYPFPAAVWHAELSWVFTSQCGHVPYSITITILMIINYYY